MNFALHVFSFLHVKNSAELALNSAPQTFLTCGTLKKLAEFGGTPQQTLSMTTQKM